MRTKNHAERKWIKEELKLLYKKKTTLNRELYITHLWLLNNIHMAQLFNILHI